MNVCCNILPWRRLFSIKCENWISLSVREYEEKKQNMKLNNKFQQIDNGWVNNLGENVFPSITITVN